MKKVISGKELEEKMLEGITLLCETVAKTLGPKGRNVIIDHSDFSPFITNDGVTIAENIESDDRVINTILELTKEAAMKTNELVGDGTTTTLVLLEELYKKGKKLIDEGYSPIILKKELIAKVNETIKKIEEEKRIPTEEEIKSIASISGQDDEIGEILLKSYQKVGVNNILIKEHNKEETEIEYLKGYRINTVVASPYFFKNENKIQLKNPNILLVDKELYETEELSDIINNTLESKKDLLIMARDYSDDLINTILDINFENHLKIVLLKFPSYGENAYEIIKDISCLSKCNVISPNSVVTLYDLGTLEEISVEKEETILNFKWSELIEERLEELKEHLKNIDEFKKEEYEKRIAMLKNGLIEIKVGAITTTERREKKMRFDDALCAIKSIDEGVLPGCGIIYYKLSETLEENNKINELLKEAFKKPMRQILENASLNIDEILNKIKENNYQTLYNVSTDKYESLKTTDVIDTFEVVINSLKNAVSIAGMLLTTSSIVINELETHERKINWNEL